MKKDIPSDVLSMNINELQSLMSELNEPSYRGEQIFEWLHRRKAESFQEMDNLPKKLRASLEEHCRIPSCKLAETLSSKKDGTEKFLFELEDGTFIESVLMQYDFGYSICISTQAGCRMGCKFCASAQGGLLRNLTAGEMCSQIYFAMGREANAGKKLAGIVLMGCGEPLDNFEQVVRFLELIGHPKGAGVGARHITISTCGLVPQMIKLADMQLQITLAISLHGPDDRIRKSLMPIANKYPIHELIEACRYYIRMTNRRITFEYALIKGVNDNPSHASALSKLLKGMLCHVNLIPVNQVAWASSSGTERPAETSGDYSPTLRRDAEAFANVLQRNHIQTTIRRTIGSDVNAACGQLRTKKMRE